MVTFIGTQGDEVNDLTLICETCGFPIERGKGSVYVRIGDLRDYREAMREWRESHAEGAAVDLAELLLQPDEIHWRTGHDACRTDRSEGCYEIDDHKISSWTQLAWWTAHLMSKNWLTHSDWDEFLREISGEVPSSRVSVTAREAA